MRMVKGIVKRLPYTGLQGKGVLGNGGLGEEGLVR